MRNMLFSTMRPWWVWLRNMFRQAPQPPAPALELPTPTVLGLVMQETVEPAVPMRLMRFRGQTWQQTAPADAQGIVTFTREVAVNGRPVLSELRVHEADLVARGDVFHLNGRD